MRAHNFLTEAAMNPTEFGRALARGQETGVLIGYEFEVCVPLKSLSDRTFSAMDSGEKIKRLPGIFFSRSEARGMFDYGLFMQLFPHLGESQFTTSNAAYRAWVDNIIGRAQRVWGSISQQTRQDLERRYMPMVKSTQGIGNYRSDELQFIKLLNDDNTRTLSLPHLKRIQTIWSEYLTGANYFFKFIWGNKISPHYSGVTPYYAAKKYLPNPNIEAIDTVLKSTGAMSVDRINHSTAKKIAASIIKQRLGVDVIVFDSYHQHKKDSVHYYIEPDGSLEPGPGEIAFEFVTPPLQPRSAIDILQRFYELARELGMRTDARRKTGLHINVSIPQKLDLLKLVVFGGDEHVLKSFGRLNNSYCKSVLRSLKQNLKYGTDDVGNRLSRRESISTEKGRQVLNSIAGDIMKAHFASMSSSGRYISFRGTGGDYLNRFQDIANATGRWVRLLQIASDRDAYRREYITKLTALIDSTKPAPPRSNTDTIRDSIEQYNQIKSDGLPAIYYYVYWKPGSDDSDNSQLISRLESIVTGQLDSTSRRRWYIADIRKDFEFTITPQNEDQIQEFRDKLVNQGYHSDIAKRFPRSPDNCMIVTVTPKHPGVVDTIKDWPDDDFQTMWDKRYTKVIGLLSIGGPVTVSPQSSITEKYLATARATIQARIQKLRSRKKTDNKSKLPESENVDEIS